MANSSMVGMFVFFLGFMYWYTTYFVPSSHIFFWLENLTTVTLWKTDKIEPYQKQALKSFWIKAVSSIISQLWLTLFYGQDIIFL